MSDLILAGGPGNDTLAGGAGNDTIKGLGGDDWLYGQGGNDLVNGGTGSDNLSGGEGDDVYTLGFGGIDFIFDTAGNDEVQLTGVSAATLERLRFGDDLVLQVAGSPSDVLILDDWFLDAAHRIESVKIGATEWSATTLASLLRLGTSGDDTILGSQYGERIQAGTGSDSLSGGEGDDVYALGFGGLDFIFDTGGDDQVQLTGVSAATLERLRFGNDLVLQVAGSPSDFLILDEWFLDPAYRIESVKIGATEWSATTLASLLRLGTSGDDTILGSQYGERIQAGTGSDSLSGGEGDDVYTLGFGGLDFIFDTGGNDQVQLSGVSAATLERLRFGNDLVLQVAGSLTGDMLILDEWFLDGAYRIESVTIGATEWSATTLASLLRLGTSGNDTITGSQYAEVIDGRGGADVMTGGDGNDIYYVGPGGDQVVENAGEGVDTVRSTVTHTLASNVENLELIGAAAVTGVGNGENNVLSGTGNSAANRLSGGGGDDIYHVGAGDTAVEGLNAGNDTVYASVDFTLANNVEALVLAAEAGDIDGTGNNGANWLTGNEGDNVLSGLGGADALRGGYGNDTLTGGGAVDAFYFAETPGADNADHITDFALTERIYLDDAAFAGIGAVGAFGPDDARFYQAANATGGADADDRIVYDTVTGSLYFDPDGDGFEVAQLIGVLDNQAALAATHFEVI